VRHCWAARLGECSTKITREHIITEGVFPGGEIFVQGFPWCLNEPVKIGLANLTAKVLCARHNSQLSDVDMAGIDTVKAFQQANQLIDFRNRYRRTAWTRKQFKIDGPKLERWFLKTLINMAFRGERRIGSGSTEVGQPSLDLVETAFGLRQFSDWAGLYAVGAVGDQNPTDGRVRATLLTTTRDYIAGAVFHFGSMKYLLYLEKGARPGPQNFQKHEDANLHASQFLYHVRQVKCSVHDRLSHTIDFNWRLKPSGLNASLR